MTHNSSHPTPQESQQATAQPSQADSLTPPVQESRPIPSNQPAAAPNPPVAHPVNPAVPTPAPYPYPPNFAAYPPTAYAPYAPYPHPPHAAYPQAPYPHVSAGYPPVSYPQNLVVPGGQPPQGAQPAQPTGPHVPPHPNALPPSQPQLSQPLPPQLPQQVQPQFQPYVPQLAYPQALYAPYPYPVAPYPQPFVPLVKLPEPDPENEICARGYIESADYPHDQARKERIIARVVFFTVIPVLLIFFFTPYFFRSRFENVDPFLAQVGTFGFEIILILLFSLILRHAFPQGWRDALALKKPRGIHVLVGMGVGLVAVVVAIILLTIVSLLEGKTSDVSPLDTPTDIPTWQVIVYLLGFTTLVAPFLEELLFRGILVGSAVRAFPSKVGYVVAIVVTGLVFGSLHFRGTFDLSGIFVVVLISTLGIFWAWLRLKTNSAIVTMAAHITYNTSLVLISLCGYLLSSMGTLGLP